MPIDLQRELIFIHVPRTGGTSIEALFGWNRPVHFFSPKPIPGLLQEDRTPQHFTWRELLPHLPEGFAAAAFSFAFVRNPWDRCVSEFLWRRRKYARHSRRTRLPYSRSDLADLESFLRLLERPDTEHQSARLGFDGHLETQRSFLIDDQDKIAVDFIGRFERFAEDLRGILRRVGMDDATIPHMSHTRSRADHRPWFSSRTRSLVESFYQEDIREFGYRF